jgi:succinate dehydrogenase/fumarate reductase flavoprotein subunit
MRFDVLIVGAGGAGLYAALEAAKKCKRFKSWSFNKSISYKKPYRSCSRWD